MQLWKNVSNHATLEKFLKAFNPNCHICYNPRFIRQYVHLEGFMGMEMALRTCMYTVKQPNKDLYLAKYLTKSSMMRYVWSNTKISHELLFYEIFSWVACFILSFFVICKLCSLGVCNTVVGSISPGSLH